MRGALHSRFAESKPIEHSALNSSSVHSPVMVAMISCSPLMRRMFPLGSPQYSASNLPGFTVCCMVNSSSKPGMGAPELRPRQQSYPSPERRATQTHPMTLGVNGFVFSVRCIPAHNTCRVPAFAPFVVWESELLPLVCAWIEKCYLTFEARCVSQLFRSLKTGRDIVTLQPRT